MQQDSSRPPLVRLNQRTSATLMSSSSSSSSTSSLNSDYDTRRSKPRRLHNRQRRLMSHTDDEDSDGGTVWWWDGLGESLTAVTDLPEWDASSWLQRNSGAFEMLTPHRQQQEQQQQQHQLRLEDGHEQENEMMATSKAAATDTPAENVEAEHGNKIIVDGTIEHREGFSSNVAETVEAPLQESSLPHWPSKSALRLASARGRLDVVRQLLDAGCSNLNGQDHVVRIFHLSR